MTSNRAWKAVCTKSENCGDEARPPVPYRAIKGRRLPPPPPTEPPKPPTLPPRRGAGPPGVEDGTRGQLYVRGDSGRSTRRRRTFRRPALTNLQRSSSMRRTRSNLTNGSWRFVHSVDFDDGEDDATASKPTLNPKIMSMAVVKDTLWIARYCGDVVVINIGESSGSNLEYGQVVACMTSELYTEGEGRLPRSLHLTSRRAYSVHEARGNMADSSHGVIVWDAWGVDSFLHYPTLLNSKPKQAQQEWWICFENVIFIKHKNELRACSAHEKFTDMLHDIWWTLCLYVFNSTTQWLLLTTTVFTW